MCLFKIIGNHLSGDDLCFGTLMTLYHMCCIQACSFTITRSVSSIKMIMTGVSIQS